MNILITGIGGFIGNAIAEKLSKNHKIYGIYRNKKPKLKNKKNIKLICCDLNNPKNLPFRCDYIIHAASETPNRTKDNRKIFNSNTLSMKNLIEYSIKVKPKNFLFLSSNSVYGKNNQKTINEKSRFIKPNSYGQSKIECEKFLRSFSIKQYNTKCLSLRLPGVVGRNSRDNFISNTLTKVINKKDVDVYNKKALFNNLVHIDDLVQYTTKWMKFQKTQYNMFNIAASHPIRLEEVAKTFIKILKKQVKIKSNFIGKKPFTIETNIAKSNGFLIKKTKNILVKYAREVASLK